MAQFASSREVVEPITPDFTLSAGEYDGVPVLEVTGEIDIGKGDALKKAVVGLGQGPPGSFAIVDLTRVSFIDSTGLSALMVGERHFRSLGRKLRLVVSEPAVLRVFEVTNLVAVIDTFPSLAAAAQSTGNAGTPATRMDGTMGPPPVL